MVSIGTVLDEIGDVFVLKEEFVYGAKSLQVAMFGILQTFKFLNQGMKRLSCEKNIFLKTKSEVPNETLVTETRPVNNQKEDRG